MKYTQSEIMTIKQFVIFELKLGIIRNGFNWIHKAEDNLGMVEFTEHQDEVVGL